VADAQGIGLEIVRALCADSSLEVVLASRDRERGAEAVEAISAAGDGRPSLLVLDVTSAASIASAKAFVEERGGQLYCLVNNAGMAYKGSTFGAEEAQTTLATNLYGTMDLTEALLPYLQAAARAGLPARVVNVASQAGRLNQISAALQGRVQDKDLRAADVRALGAEFVDHIKRGDHEAAGWSNSMYGVSKLLLIAWSIALARQLKHDGIYVHACCPGWCKTDMSSHKGPRSAAKGAETPAWLVTAPLPEWGEHATGAFFYDKHAISW
jgi:carbonyl reductase 1